MSKTRFLILAVILLAALNVAVLTFLVVGRRPPHREAPRQVIIERLHFDDEQVATYDRLIEKHHTEIRQKDTEMIAKRQVIYQSLKTDDYRQADSLIYEIGLLQRDIEQIHFDHFRNIKRLCRPEQRADFDVLVDDLANLFPMKKGPKKARNQ